MLKKDLFFTFPTRKKVTEKIFVIRKSICPNLLKEILAQEIFL